MNVSVGMILFRVVATHLAQIVMGVIVLEKPIVGMTMDSEIPQQLAVVLVIDKYGIVAKLLKTHV